MSMTTQINEGLIKQAFIADRLLNDWWVSTSPVVNSLLLGKEKWNFTNKFEYRALMGTGASYGTLNGQVMDTFNRMLYPMDPVYGVFMAEYGQIVDGMSIDMLETLETDNMKSFRNATAVKLFQMRRSMAAGFKNYAIHGQFGVVAQLDENIPAPTAGVNPQPNTGFTPTFNTEFTIQITSTTSNIDMNAGGLLIKTQSAAETDADYKFAPCAYADCAELYRIVRMEPYRMTLKAVSMTSSPWENGDYLEVFGNRIPEGSADSQIPNQGFDVDGHWLGTGVYTHGANALVGSFEGYADLFPWYTDPANPEKRLMLKMPFRNQPNRVEWEFQQCGGWIVQEPNEPIMDAIMRGVAYSAASVDSDAMGISWNPDTKLAVGRQEGMNNFRTIKEVTSAQPYVYQRGIKESVYQIGSRTLGTVVEDRNIPTDIVCIGPKLGTDMSWNCWDNSMAQIDQYIRDSFEPDKGPTVDTINWREIGELVSKMDIDKRITIGQPRSFDGPRPDQSLFQGSRIMHPRNVIPITMMEAGAMFTKCPFKYTIVKLRHKIGNGGVVFEP